MRTTVDRAGRIVVPKARRDELNLEPGQELDARVTDRRLEIEPAPTPMRLERRDGVLVAVPDRDLPPLTAEQVRGHA